MAFRPLAEAFRPTTGPRPQRPLSARGTCENTPPDDNAVTRRARPQRTMSQKTLTRPPSADRGAVLPTETPKKINEAAVDTEQEETLRANAAEAVGVAGASLSATSTVDLSVLDPVRDEPEAMRAVMRAAPANTKFDYKNNEARNKEWIKKLKGVVVQQMALRKVHGDAVRSVQEAINARLHTLTEELSSQRVTHNAILNQVAQQARETEANFERRLEEGARRLQEWSAAAQQRENGLREELLAEEEERKRTAASLEGAQQGLKEVREELAQCKASLAAQVEQTTKIAEEKRILQVEFDSYKEHHGTTSEQQMSAIAELKVMVGDLSKQVDSTRQQVIVKESNLDEERKRIEDLQRSLMEEERRRREMHNAMQELKGNIRVFCRVRPAADQDSEVALRVADAASSMNVAWNGENYEFGYDRVFGSAATQEVIFEEVEGLVQSALDGYKVCIFAYGQTGSGKTFTMQGTKAPNKWGVIPRALSQILKARDELQAKGWLWSIQASFMEVYNETIRDLLNEDSSDPTPTHTIVHDDVWGSQVTNMTSVSVDSLDQVRGIMAKAAKQRSVGTTDMNSVSSRSHAVFALYLKGTNEGLSTELSGALHLVDLAGSERLDKSCSTGSRLRETQNINRSLSSLADVFCAKVENRSHVPFRNSKLTHLMEPCLSGHGKTLMVVNVAPEQDHAHETLCSLRFASQVSQCNTGGKPVRAAKTISGAPQPQVAGPKSRPGTPGRAQPTGRR